MSDETFKVEYVLSKEDWQVALRYHKATLPTRRVWVRPLLYLAMLLGTLPSAFVSWHWGFPVLAVSGILCFLVPFVAIFEWYNRRQPTMPKEGAVCFAAVSPECMEYGNPAGQMRWNWGSIELLEEYQQLIFVKGPSVLVIAPFSAFATAGEAQAFLEAARRYRRESPPAWKEPELPAPPSEEPEVIVPGSSTGRKAESWRKMAMICGGLGAGVMALATLWQIWASTFTWFSGVAVFAGQSVSMSVGTLAALMVVAQIAGALRSDKASSTQRIQLRFAGVFVQTREEETLLFWSAFSCLDEKPDSIRFVLKTHKKMSLPRKVFSTPEEERRFVAFARKMLPPTGE